MSRLVAILVAAVVITACGGPKPVASVSPNPTPSPSPETSPSPLESPTPSEAPSPPPPVGRPLGTVNFTCRLPVLIQGRPLYGWTGGFIQFPGGTFKADPSGVIQAVGDGDIGTDARPALTANGGEPPFYDLVARRWLPLGPGLTAPDGWSYAYVVHELGGPDYFVEIVQVATGVNHFWKLHPPPVATGTGWAAEDYDGRYLYVAATQTDNVPKGVWRFDPGTGKLTQLLPITAGRVLLVRGGVAWVGTNNPGDAAPPKPAKGVAFDTIESINLATSSSTTWVYRAGQSVALWGLDSSSHPVVIVTSPPKFGAVRDLALIDVPGGEGTAVPAGLLPQGTMQADGNRLWFSGPQGLYYWTRATGLRQVYEFKKTPPLNEMMIPAGRCV